VCGKWHADLIGDNIAGGVRLEEWDLFHAMILSEEVCRCGSGGVAWALFGGLSIGLPPILKFGSKALRQRIGPPCLRGEKIICLAITEPTAGSDVANLQCEAKKTPDGKHYIVSGEKKYELICVSTASVF
jgi:alkylation response protein AidB-like acyl-CoA dehydrogenase